MSSPKALLPGTIRLLLLILLLPAFSFADNIFVEFKGSQDANLTLVGSSQTDGFVNQIVAQSIQWGQGTSVSPSSKGFLASKPSFSDISITKELDKSSPKLMQASAVGNKYRDVIISFTRSNSAPGGSSTEFVYLKIELKDVLITSLSTSHATGGGSVPNESVSLVFGAIKTTFTPQKSDGTADTAVVGQWNIITNRPDFRDVESSTSEPVPADGKPASTGTEVTVE